MIIAVAFGAEAPSPKSHYPIITGGRAHKPEVTGQWITMYKVDCVDFGPVPKYEGLSVNDEELVRKMKLELVTPEVFGGSERNIHHVFVNGKDYGSHYIIHTITE